MLTFVFVGVVGVVVAVVFVGVVGVAVVSVVFFSVVVVVVGVFVFVFVLVVLILLVAEMLTFEGENNKPSVWIVPLARKLSPLPPSAVV